MRREDYDKENDIIIVNFGNVVHSRELRNVNVVVDFDKDDNIVGIEIFDFLKAMDEEQKIIDKIFSSKDEKPKNIRKEMWDELSKKHKGNYDKIMEELDKF